MGEVQRFIVHTKKAEKQLREQAKKQVDPFKNDEKKKVQIPKELQYAKGETFRCKVRYPRRQECSNDEEHQGLKGIANFVSKIEWQNEWNEEGGITWLEMYVLFRTHSKKVVLDPLSNIKPLLQDVTKFKSQMRKIATRCINEEDEWVLRTCYGRQNRLKGAAIDNKHAGVQGMPKLTQTEAETIINAILAMKGATTSKHQEAHQQGTLSLLPRPLTYRGTAKGWCTRLYLEDDWTHDRTYVLDEIMNQRPLNHIMCPVCMEEMPTKTMKMKDQSNFSNLKCQACKSATTSRKWLCDCGCLWFKCSVHFRAKYPQIQSTKRVCKRKFSSRGVDLPFPKFRKRTNMHEHVFTEQAVQNVWKPPPGSTLALRFPHLVEGASPT